MRILIDVDGVLADCLSPVLLECERRTGRRPQLTSWDLPPDVMAVFREMASRPGYALGLEEYPGAWDAIDRLDDRHEVVFVTSPYGPCPTWAHERELWLHSRWPGIHVVHTAAKRLIRGDILIDDSPANCSSWAAEHPQGRPVLWLREYNHGAEGSFTKLGEWDSLHRFIGEAETWL